MEGIGVSIQDLAAYFYANDGLFVLTQLEMLQREFEILKDLSDWVSLLKNTRKTVIMERQLCHTPGRMSVVVYGRRTTGTGVTGASVHAPRQRNSTYVQTFRWSIYETRRPEHPHSPIR